MAVREEWFFGCGNGSAFTQLSEGVKGAQTVALGLNE